MKTVFLLKATKFQDQTSNVDNTINTNYLLEIPAYIKKINKIFF